jgi:hypothetical protein
MGRPTIYAGGILPPQSEACVQRVAVPGSSRTAGTNGLRVPYDGRKTYAHVSADVSRSGASGALLWSAANSESLEEFYGDNPYRE